jgi:hypothetical protein
MQVAGDVLVILSRERICAPNLANYLSHQGVFKSIGRIRALPFSQNL